MMLWLTAFVILLDTAKIFEGRKNVDGLIR